MVNLFKMFGHIFVSGFQILLQEEGVLEVRFAERVVRVWPVAALRDRQQQAEQK